MTFISTAGHGYLKVSTSQLKKAYLKGFIPTSYSFISKSAVLLEEDCDASGFMVAMYPNDIERQAKWKSIKDKYQDNINREKYMHTPQTLQEFEDMLEIFNVSSSKVGMTMTTIGGSEYQIIGTQKNGYIYRDGGVWNMPFTRIAKISETA